MKNGHRGEVLARRAIEDRGFIVHNANILLGTNCPNVDLVLFNREGAFYVQVKTSVHPSRPTAVIVDGSAWTHEQLYENAPLYNKHDAMQAKLLVIVDVQRDGPAQFYIAQPEPIEDMVRRSGLAYAALPKQNGEARKITFRKELPREQLSDYLNAWHLLGEPGLGLPAGGEACSTCGSPLRPIGDAVAVEIFPANGALRRMGSKMGFAP